MSTATTASEIQVQERKTFPLTAGLKAPAFAAQTLRGGRLTLDDLRGGPVLLKFYRFATCPVCNLHLRGFIKRHHELARTGLRTVVLFHSPRARLEKAIETALPFDVIPDPGKEIFRAYGVTGSLRGMFHPRVMADYARALVAGFSAGMLSHDGGIQGHPADFLIDAGGTVRLAHYGSHYADSLDTDAVLKALRT
jgi:peroxiredoxin